jgi:hypothetical protein
MRSLLTVSFVLARLAAAQPGLEDPPPPPAPPAPAPHVENLFVSGGALITVDHFLNAAWFADAGVRLGDLPLAVHASIAKGGSLDADNGGDFWRWTAGVEARSSRAGNYAFLDLDIGHQRQTWGDEVDLELGEYEVHQGALAIGRVGYDAGGEHIRFRAAFEMYSYNREFVGEMTSAWQTGGGISLAVGYRN